MARPALLGALSLSDADEKARAAVSVLRQGDPGLNLFDKDGKVFWKAP
jgi:hypothetical protein